MNRDQVKELLCRNYALTLLDEYQLLGLIILGNFLDKNLQKKRDLMVEIGEVSRPWHEPMHREEKKIR